MKLRRIKVRKVAHMRVQSWRGPWIHVNERRRYLARKGGRWAYDGEIGHIENLAIVVMELRR